MRLPFVDRESEVDRIRRAFARPGTRLTVVYGRRRCGKSRLVQRVLDPRRDAYYMADLRDGAVQRAAAATEIGRVIHGFGAAIYPDWTSLLEAWRERASDTATLALDEFPYLAQISPELPSVVQKVIDGSRSLRLLLCGSSQRMMHGLVLDQTAPLYGRASEILKIEPMSVRWLARALEVEGEAAVESYAVWGGLPRNWELAADYRKTAGAIKAVILDRNGVLHGEPPRLLLDDMRSAVQANSILSLIGAGCNRLSEIAGRIGHPAASLSRPLARLIDLGYVQRDVPFGETARSTTRTLYRMADPFIAFWYRFVLPNESLLARDLVDEVFDRVCDGLGLHVGAVWEQMARASVTKLKAGGVRWAPAGRWWGRGRDGKPMEIDVVAESLDRQHRLVGEAEWSIRPDLPRLAQELRHKAQQLPFAERRTIHHALWLRRPPERGIPGVTVIGPDETIEAAE